MPIKPKKKLGQHFLKDPLIIDRLLRIMTTKDKGNFVEIGPGTGAITLPLASCVDHVTAIEIDIELACRLKTTAPDNLSLICQDVLTFDFTRLPPNTNLVGNLPYQITSPLLLRLCQQSKHLAEVTFMVQEEVANRIIATPCTRAFGRLSVMLQTYFKIDKLIIIPNHAFFPKPKISSALIHLTPKTTLPRVKFFHYENLIKRCFSQPRKTLNNCLKFGGSIPKTNINLLQRAEQLSIEEFLQLASDYEK